MAYHPAAPLPGGFSGWQEFENKISNVITNKQRLRSDVTNLKAATEAAAITDVSTATAAATLAVLV